MVFWTRLVAALAGLAMVVVSAGTVWQFPAALAFWGACMWTVWSVAGDGR